MARETLKRQKEQERQAAIAHLREILQPGDRVYGIVKHVSRSGMSRNIDFYTFKDGDRVYLSGWIATAFGDYRRDKWGALVVPGCGMDMIFHIVYNLGYVLFPEGFGLPADTGTTKGPLHWQAGYRPETKQEAAKMVEAGAKFFGRNGDRSGWDDDGGYALKHEQL